MEVEIALWRSAGGGTAQWPGAVKAAAVARIVKVSRAAVGKWREDPAYRQGFWFSSGVVAQLSAHLDDAARRERSSPKKTLIGVGAKREHRRANLLLFVEKHWAGPTKSPINGLTYDDVEEYVEHLLDANGVIVAD